MIASGLRRAFASSSNAAKQLIHALSCASSSYDKFATGEFWRALKKLEQLSARSEAILTPLMCSPNLQPAP